MRITGDGSGLSHDIPTLIGSDSDWVEITANGPHSCATKTTGELYCWGHNGAGQLGDGTWVAKHSPVLVIK